MKKLLIVNKGAIEPEALTLLGASTKRGDSGKIGQFGSGNKYALAYLLNTGRKIRIISGGEEIKINLVTKTFRDRDFNVLCINDKETSITTDFGYNWTLWQSIRELYSNAVDEGIILFALRSDNELNPEIDRYMNEASDEDSQKITIISIEADAEIETMMFNIQDYFAIGNEVLFENEYGKIYRKHSGKTCIYYKGIRCYETLKESIYDYDFNKLDIGEDRLIRYSWTLPEAMYRLIFSCENPVLIRTLLESVQDPKYIENSIQDSFVSIPDIERIGVWKEALEGNTIVPRDMGGYVKDEDRAKTLFLPGKLYTALIGALGNGHKNPAFTMSKKGQLFTTARGTELQTATLNKARHFFAEVKYHDALKYPVILAEFDDKSVLGTVSEDDEVLISTQTVDAGVQLTITVILEEVLHIKSGRRDCTREFQNAIFSEFVNYMKTINAYTI